MLEVIRASITTMLMLFSPSADPVDGIGGPQSPIAMNTEFNADPSPDIYTSESNGVLTLIGGPQYTDTFPSSTSVTQVVVTIYPPATGSIEVVALSGPTWVETTGGAWQATFPMPSPGIEKKADIEVTPEEGDPNGGVIIIGRDGP